MTRSRYVTIVESADASCALFVHGITGAMDIVGSELLRWFRSDLPGSALDADLIERLERRGYLWQPSRGVEAEYFSALSAALHRQRVETTINSFWIIPTYKCNLRCYYCFQAHALHEGKGLGERDMTPEEACRLIDALDGIGGAGPRASQGKGRYLTLFGGEPLMQSTRETVAAIVRKGHEKGYRVGAVTNGIDLVAFEDLLGPDQIRWIQITLDGLDAMNDKRRLPVLGSGFRKIVEGISVALKRGVQISLRTNADRRLAAEVEALEAWAAAQGWTTNANFSWYMTPVEAHNNHSLDRVTIPMQTLIDTVAQSGNGTIRVPYRGKFLRLFKTLVTDGIDNDIETSSCGAHTRMYFFDPHGLIYACAEQVGRPETAVGKVAASGVNLDSDQAGVWLTRHVGNMPVCSGCSQAFFCGGGCANAANIETGDFLGPRCHGIKEAFQATGREYLTKVAADLRASGVSLDTLDMHRLNSDDVVLASRSSFDGIVGAG